MNEVYVDISKDTDLSKKFPSGYISIEQLFDLYYDLDYEYNRLKERLEELERDNETDNYDDI